MPTPWTVFKAELRQKWEAPIVCLVTPSVVTFGTFWRGEGSGYLFLTCTRSHFWLSSLWQNELEVCPPSFPRSLLWHFRHFRGPRRLQSAARFTLVQQVTCPRQCMCLNYVYWRVDSRLVQWPHKPLPGTKYNRVSNPMHTSCNILPGLLYRLLVTWSDLWF